MRIRALSALMVTGLLTAGCAQAGQLGEVLGGVLNAPAQGGQVAGEVVSIDTRNQQIQVRASNNQTGWIGYDSNTRVIYQNREYAVNSLEPGDQVSMTVENRGNNQLYTRQITVTQSVQDRTGTPANPSADGLQRLEGTVGTIDRTRGTFELRSGGNSTTMVLSYNASSSVRDYYNRLRPGDYVRVEGRWLGQNQLSVERFY